MCSFKIWWFEQFVRSNDELDLGDDPEYCLTYSSESDISFKVLDLKEEPVCEKTENVMYFLWVM